MLQGRDKPLIPSFRYLMLPEVLLGCIISLRLPQLVKLAGLLVYVYVNYRGATYFTTGHAWYDYGTGCMFGNNILTAIDFSFLTNFRDLRWDPQGRNVAYSALAPLKRLWWVLCLKGSVRGVNYSTQVSHVPPLPKDSRRHFVIKCLLLSLAHYLMANVAETYISVNTVFAQGNMDGLTSQGRWFRFLNLTAIWVDMYGTLNGHYHALALVSVSLGFTEPKHWPNFFGRWADAYTLRRFWGRTWHQMFRRLASNYGTSAARALGLAKGSWWSSHVQLFVGFIVTGVLHSTGDRMISAPRTFTSLAFFVLQAVAITCEDLLISLVGIPEPTAFSKWLGYTWVSIWLYVTLPGLAWFWGPGAGAGFVELLPWSPTSQLLQSFNFDLTQIFPSS